MLPFRLISHHTSQVVILRISTFCLAPSVYSSTARRCLPSALCLSLYFDTTCASSTTADPSYSKDHPTRRPAVPPSQHCLRQHHHYYWLHPGGSRPSYFGALHRVKVTFSPMASSTGFQWELLLSMTHHASSVP